MNQEDTGDLDETRSINLGGLLSGLLGNTGSASGEDASERAEPLGGLGELLGPLLGGGDALDPSGLVGNEGLSQSALQGIVPLILGALAGQGQDQGGVSRATLDDLAQGKAGAADALAGSGLLQDVMRRTGLSQSGALGVIMAVLKALGLGKTSSAAHTKPKPKPKPAAKPKPKPKPSASAASKPKPKPRPSASTAAKPKPKPKPTSHAASSAKPKPKPKAKPKPRPKRSGEVGLGDVNPPADQAA